MTPKEFPRIIGFTGLAGAGKSTAAFFVVGHYADFRRLSFADPLRDMLAAIGLGYNPMLMEKNTPHYLLCGKTPRYALQTLGTEWGRNLIGPDLWKNAAMSRAKIALANGERVVFDDVRFDNEAAAIREMGGIIIELLNPNVTTRMAHASEAGIDGHHIDCVISANSVSALKEQLTSKFNAYAPY